MYIERNEYLRLRFMFYVEGRQANKRAFSISFLPFVYFFAALQRSFKISHILASFWAFMHRFGLKFSRVLLAHLYNKYLSSAVKTSRANNTPKVL